MKTSLVNILIIAAALAGVAQSHADIGTPFSWRISTNGWSNGINANGTKHGHGSRHDLNPSLPIGTRPDVRNDPASLLPSLRDLASHPLAR